MAAATSAVGENALNVSQDSSFLGSVFRALRNKDGPPSPRPQRRGSANTSFNAQPPGLEARAQVAPGIASEAGAAGDQPGASDALVPGRGHAVALLQHALAQFGDGRRPLLERLCRDYSECLAHQIETVLDWLCGDSELDKVGGGWAGASRRSVLLPLNLWGEPCFSARPVCLFLAFASSSCHSLTMLLTPQVTFNLLENLHYSLEELGFFRPARLNDTLLQAAYNSLPRQVFISYLEAGIFQVTAAFVGQCLQTMRDCEENAQFFYFLLVQLCKREPVMREVVEDWKHRDVER